MRLLIFTQVMDRNDPVLGFFHRWVEEFSKHAESIILVCLFEGEHDLPKNVRVSSLGKEGGRSRIKYLKRFYTYIWRERKHYDSVFVHMNQIYVVLGALLWHLWGKRVGLWYAHGSVSLGLRVAEKLADVIFTSTPEGFRIKSDKVHVVGQGIDIDFFKPKEGEIKKHDPLGLVTVGRVSPAKGLETILRALGKLPDNLAFRLRIVGGSESDGHLHKLQEMIKEEGIEDRVEFVGPVPPEQIVEYLQSSDLFLSAGKTGSLDKAILEALACGVPVLTSNDAARVELEEMKEVSVFKEGDASDLSEKIVVWRRISNEEYQIHSRKSVQIVRRHTLSNLIRETYDLLTTQND